MIEFVEKLPSSDELKEEIPFSADLQSKKQKRDSKIKQVMVGESNLFTLIIGPCSAHDESAVFEYVKRLAKLEEEVADKMILIPRVYTNKPRTTGEGYKGIAHQADLSSEPNMVEGMKAMRRLHIGVHQESGLSPADEMLYPGNYPYLDDLLSYVAVGARSVENQEHRLTISGLEIPAGMKNPTSGDIEIMLNSVHAAQLPHDFSYNGWRVKTSGNELAHCILRGAVNQYGRNIPNYHYEDLHRLQEAYAKRDLKNPTVFVDTNHGNSNKAFHEQSRIALEVIRTRQSSNDLTSMVKGLMIESFLVEGRQEPGGSTFGQSVTDPCISWDTSVDLVRNIAELL